MPNDHPAFPVPMVGNDECFACTSVEHMGLFVRDYFAAKALSGLVVMNASSPVIDLAKRAYALADAMMFEKDLLK